jgi:hypothetical protein
VLHCDAGHRENLVRAAALALLLRQAAGVPEIDAERQAAMNLKLNEGAHAAKAEQTA